MANQKTYRCGCGLYTGERCNWSGPLKDMVVVEVMPVHIRASHTAAGNSGTYPHNGAERVAVEKSCTQYLDADWECVVDADPARYAEEE